MKIAFIASAWEYDSTGQAVAPSGATYYRCVLPAACLGEFGGHTVGVFAGGTTAPSGAIAPVDEDGNAHDGFDVIVLHSIFNPEMADAIKLARSAGQTVISDVDNHFLALHWSHDARVRLDPATSPEWNTDHGTRAILASSWVTVSTQALADLVRSLGQPNVTVIPNMVDLRLWPRQPVADVVGRVGWVGLTRYRSQDLEQLGTSLRRFLRKHPTIRFVHAGDEPGAPQAAKLAGVPVSSSVLRSAVTLDRYPELWAGIDIALCPLNAIDYNRAKSAIKVMESSAAGVPYIASDLDEYRRYGCGLLASNPREWGDHLEALTDRDLRQELADAAYERIKLEGCSVRWHDWEDLYTALQGEQKSFRTQH